MNGQAGRGYETALLGEGETSKAVPGCWGNEHDCCVQHGPLTMGTESKDLMDTNDTVCISHSPPEQLQDVSA